MPTVDMSPRAVSRRLQQASDLRDLGILLAGPRLKKPWGTDPSPKTPENAAHPIPNHASLASRNHPRPNPTS